MSTLAAPGRGVLEQIALLPRSTRPLIICDVDEVVLHMILHLEEFLAARGLAFIAYSYRLTGNIAEEASGRVLGAEEVHRLVQGFFEDIADRQTIVDGAAPALTRLSEAFEIVFLTNLPGVANKPLREKLLAAHGLSFPVVTNSGPKGAAVAALSAGRGQPVVFIDDSPHNLQSVAQALPSARLIQFVADARFRQALDPLPGLDLVSGDWLETEAHIRTMIASR
ncbi:MAG: hypothetical protein ACK4HD_10800 [Pannonibacter phragmitetus]